MRPELDETLAAPGTDPACTATAPRAPATTEPVGLVPGQQLGHFRIEKPLGAGGMGEVYLATDLALERPVALKVLPAGVARDPARRDRLVREARAQARITHPNVGHIYFIGEEAGRLYFAMEYVAGETLSARIAAGPLSVDDALAIIRSAALGLREAQRNGITHRDIKPSNLMIDGHGMVKVLDFGLAASADRADSATGLAGPVAQTSLAGTPLYMAPEQARGEPVDLRADVYALGATLYHLVAGRPPFEADTLDALLSKHSSAVRPALPRRSGQPRTTIAAIDALCSRMMAPSPADRFASYDELIRAIELSSVEHMRPAGLWVRSMATFVDLMIASLVTAAVLLPIQWLFGSAGDNGTYILAIYALYASVFVARTGRTPGKWLFELEVADVVTGGKPTLRRAAIRAVVEIVAPFVAVVLGHLLKLHNPVLAGVVDGLVIVVACAPPVLLVWASLRSVSKQTVWDKLSGTIVRYRTRRPPAI
jgi:serine/threonine protein kinase